MQFRIHHIKGLVQDCSNSSALAMELLQSCTKPLIWSVSTLHKRIDYIKMYFHSCWVSCRWTNFWWFVRHMGQVTKVWLSCYLVLHSHDSKTQVTRQPHLCDSTHIIWIYFCLFMVHFSTILITDSPQLKQVFYGFKVIELSSVSDHQSQVIHICVSKLHLHWFR